MAAGPAAGPPDPPFGAESAYNQCGACGRAERARPVTRPLMRQPVTVSTPEKYQVKAVLPPARHHGPYAVSTLMVRSEPIRHWNCGRGSSEDPPHPNALLLGGVLRLRYRGCMKCEWANSGTFTHTAWLASESN